MAREKARSRAGSAWDSTFLGQNSYGQSPAPTRRTSVPSRGSFGDAEADRIHVQQTYDFRTAQDMALAMMGDDTSLLPYQPTPTINPGRPRTLAAGYDPNSMTMRIKFRDGEYYEYYQVPPSVWYTFQRVSSPGRYINTRLNNFPYKRGLS